jgi:hypothetical protein
MVRLTGTMNEKHTMDYFSLQLILGIWNAIFQSQKMAASNPEKILWLSLVFSPITVTLFSNILYDF